VIKVRRESAITEKVNHRSVDLKEAASRMSLKKLRERKFSDIQGAATVKSKFDKLTVKPEEVSKPTYGFQMKSSQLKIAEKPVIEEN
jgi:hypothetical protein